MFSVCCNIYICVLYNKYKVFYKKKTTKQTIKETINEMKWRIVNNSQCTFCGQDEGYLHYFMYCPYLF